MCSCLRFYRRELAMNKTAHAPNLKATGTQAAAASRQEEQSALMSGRALQERLLLSVSRTFALTIPQLPAALGNVISNHYLLCRIVDTIEDEPRLSPEQKRYFCDQFVDVTSNGRGASQFAQELAPKLSEHTIAAEHKLIRSTPAVIAVTFSFNQVQQEALTRCVQVMTEGMVRFQQMKNPGGLKDLPQLNQYCYYVAGVVGETLTELFSEYSPAIAANRAKLMSLAVSFGQGLQMTNILKDVWDDHRRGACWLPQDVFDDTGFDLKNLAPEDYVDAFGLGLSRLIGIAHAHLDDAVSYTLLIPKHEKGIRSFCLWAIGFAVLTLRKISRHLDFSTGDQVKISRHSVKSTILVTRLAMTHDRLVRSLFRLATQGLPKPPVRGA
jgi:farnesyl-diphosphate farnesyltransferase